MCGFAGVVSFSSRCPLPRGAALARLAKRASDDLAHRGPDGAGYWQNDPKEPTSFLVHRRLAVLDPRPRSDQPFVRGGKALAFNGELFNYRELRQNLADGAADFTTDGDTEVLLESFARRDTHCVDDFEGMFAFAVIDEKDGQPRLTLARDPAGEKPLFYALATTGDGQINGAIFASELTCLRRLALGLRWPGVGLELCKSSLQQYLAWGYLPGELTIYFGVARLLPGHIMTVTPGGTSARRFFDAGGVFELGGTDRWTSAISLTRRVVGDAVRRRMVSDVPIGCLLSGGIDSSVVALHMSQQLREAGSKLRTFSIAFDDKRYDESPHAAEVAAHLDTEHHTFHVTPRDIDVAGLLPKLAESFGEPFADSSAIPTTILARETRRDVTVALGGDAGDEMFGGYDRYRALLLGQKLGVIPTPIRTMLARLASRSRATHPKSKLTKLRRFAMTLPMSAGDRYASIMRLFQRSELQLLMPGEVAPPDPDRIAGRFFSAYLRGRDLVGAATALDRATYLPGDLLVKLDRCSMRHALEVRSPFVDRDVLKLAGTLSESGLLGRGVGKKLLRDAFACSLPASVFGRAKMGFAVPISAWLRGDLRTMSRDLLTGPSSFAREHFSTATVGRLLDDHDRGKADNGAKLYALLMIEFWHRQDQADRQSI